MEELNVPRRTGKKTVFLRIILILFILSISLNIFFLLKTNLTGNAISEQYLHLTKSSEKEPIDSNSQTTNSILHYEELKPLIMGDIEKYNATGDVGVFIQDIKTGTWMGIDEKEGFAPASLMKIPIMMAILKKVENNEMELTDVLTVTKEDFDTLYGDLYKRKIGEKINVQELLEYMITYSDNTAKNMLMRQVSMFEIDTVFKHIGVVNPYLKTEDNQTVSPRDYTRLFKSLYYTTFLAPIYSEMALDLTIDTQEEDLLPKEIPPEVQVAHKFGVNNGLLHDCGIVYHPENPYFICIMTKDLDLDKSMALIPRISKETYEFVNRKI